MFLYSPTKRKIQGVCWNEKHLQTYQKELKSMIFFFFFFLNRDRVLLSVVELLAAMCTITPVKPWKLL